MHREWQAMSRELHIRELHISRHVIGSEIDTFGIRNPATQPRRTKV